MHRAKQLIKIGGQTLLERAIEQALASKIGPVLVVYGAHQEQVTPLLQRWPVQAIYNPDWEEGLGASIRSGVEAILDQKIPDNLLIMLADQPLIDASLLQSLVSLHLDKGCIITACQYEDTIGVPAVFSPSIYSDLQKMQGDKGAKALMMKCKASHELALLFTPNAGVDLDTQEDVSDFLNQYKE